MKLIKYINDLQDGREYWIKIKKTNEISRAVYYQEPIILSYGHDNRSIYSLKPLVNFNITDTIIIIGPIPIQETPDFDQYINEDKIAYLCGCDVSRLSMVERDKLQIEFEKEFCISYLKTSLISMTDQINEYLKDKLLYSDLTDINKHKLYEANLYVTNLVKNWVNENIYQYGFVRTNETKFYIDLNINTINKSIDIEPSNCFKDIINGNINDLSMHGPSTPFGRYSKWCKSNIRR